MNNIKVKCKNTEGCQYKHINDINICKDCIFLENNEKSEQKNIEGIYNLSKRSTYIASKYTFSQSKTGLAFSKEVNSEQLIDIGILRDILEILNGNKYRNKSNFELIKEIQSYVDVLSNNVSNINKLDVINVIVCSLLLKI